MTHEANDSPVAVLLVEDDELVQLVANDILMEAGFHSVEARNAREALLILESRSDVRVVFTDWNMPGDLDGLGLALRVSEQWPQIGVIVTSGKMVPFPNQLPNGVKFISKPYHATALIDEIKTVIREFSRTDQGASVLPQGIVMHTPVTAEIGAQGIAAAVPEPDRK